MARDQDAQESNPLSGATEQERMTWASKIKPARVSRGLTQQEVAEMAGVSRNTVVSAESGSKVPQSDKLWRIMIALDLGPDPADSFPDDVHTWLAILGPLIANIPTAKRESAMVRVITMLGQEIAGGTRPDIAFPAIPVESNAAADNVHNLIRRDQGLNPDGMPPFDPEEILAAREVPDDLSSLRPSTPNPEDAPDPDGPDGGA
ncbi:helix-turn-helix domain-containing protein [Rhodococcus hoagii]|nr:helix-turn-helix domain-containing protein [Prescottella equi]MBM4527219.1 helix-turn-helix domain-containing protein [Prescottella equi]MBM4652995.1 helix-turn-helix domain-containing protein [Prescottella equi]MBM4687735.1 helix-turn-helix domain-containing protein [Prescottella equi]